MTTNTKVFNFFKTYSANIKNKATLTLGNSSEPIESTMHILEDKLDPQLQNIQRKMKQVGYDVDMQGICKGISAMWMQAALVDDLETFKGRYKKLLNSSPAYMRQLFNSKSEDRWDIQAFFDGIYLNQSPKKATDIFNDQRKQAQNNMEMVKSMELDNKRVDSVYKETIQGDSDSITTNLNQLINQLDDEKKQIVLGCAIPGHAFGIRYDPTNNQDKPWVLMEPNANGEKRVKDKNIGKEVYNIAKSIEQNDGQNVILNIDVTASENNQSIANKLHNKPKMEIGEISNESIQAISEMVAALDDPDEFERYYNHFAGEINAKDWVRCAFHSGSYNILNRMLEINKNNNTAKFNLTNNKNIAASTNDCIDLIANNHKVYTDQWIDFAAQAMENDYNHSAQRLLSHIPEKEKHTEGYEAANDLLDDEDISTTTKVKMLDLLHNNGFDLSSPKGEHSLASMAHENNQSAIYDKLISLNIQANEEVESQERSELINRKQTINAQLTKLERYIDQAENSGLSEPRKNTLQKKIEKVREAIDMLNHPEENNDIHSAKTQDVQQKNMSYLNQAEEMLDDIQNTKGVLKDNDGQPKTKIIELINKISAKFESLGKALDNMATKVLGEKINKQAGPSQ